MVGDSANFCVAICIGALKRIMWLFSAIMCINAGCARVINRLLRNQCGVTIIVAAAAGAP